MQIPFEFWTVSLWLAVTSIILLITVQLASAYDGQATLILDQKKLRAIAVVVGVLFLIMMVIRVYEIATSK